ncbi:MAG: TlpA family protein disulfide reductase [Acidobacteria bacterium]|nr:TlpA family protein disulfide reductase [Acidobacteriota bacterium]MDW7984115.1 TlpA disulfide reductase family protein [Acidobacteriota bacterium]
MGNKMWTLGILTGAIALATALSGVACKKGSSSHHDSDVRRGPLLPQGIPLKDLNGQTVSLDSFAGKALIINFWASWCGPCKEEMPDLQRLYDRWKEQGLVVIGISVDASLEDAKGFVEEHQFSYPIFWDGDDGPAARALGGIVALPTTFLYDRQGLRVRRIIGPQSLKEFEAMVQPLIESHRVERQ